MNETRQEMELPRENPQVSCFGDKVDDCATGMIKGIREGGIV